MMVVVTHSRLPAVTGRHRIRAVQGFKRVGPAFGELPEKPPRTWQQWNAFT